MAFSTTLYDYFGGRLAIEFKLCNMILDSDFSTPKLNTDQIDIYTQVRDLVEHQTNHIETTFSTLTDDEQDILNQSYGKDKLTANTLARIYKTTPNHINKIRQKFTQRYKKTGGDVRNHHDLLKIAVEINKAVAK
ncbi:hypothetical protein WKK_05325 [Weissella koreensis KACC 15510]|uniref:hypothetical protein n=1 Tax=Weissella koreensis TaxID=165096 RepID=UPI0002175049|nr:hypothetical protein [Weissella koreensis]AEJ23936.1 hypothetical protein WKK_05325 [Weissella koreensis KACC 15510]